MKNLGMLGVALGFMHLNAYANLPDEINYSPYERQYQALSANVDRITSELTRAEDNLSTAYSDEQSLTNAILDYENANDDLRADINSSLNELTQLRSDVIDLDSQVDQLSRRVQRLHREEAQLERRIRQEDSNLNPLRARLDKKRVELKQVSASLQQSQRKKDRIKANLEQKNNDISRLVSKRSQLEAELKAKKRQMSDIDSKIEQANREQSNLPSQIRSAQQTKDSEKKKLDVLNVELERKRAELRALTQSGERGPKLREKRMEVAQKAKEARAQQQVFHRADQKLTSLQGMKKNIEKRITSLKNQKKSLPREIEQVSRQITKTAADISSMKSKAASIKSNLALANRELSKVQALRNDTKSRVDQLQRKLDSDSQILRQFAVERSDVQNRLANVIEKQKVANNQLTHTENEINRLERLVPELRSSIRSNDAQISKYKNDLKVVQSDIISLNRIVNDLSNEQRTEVSKRDQKYSEYITRYNFYTDKLDEAKEIGASQTDIAYDLGIKDSNTYVSKRASELALQIGQEHAQAQADLWGSVRSEISGYAEGHAIGTSSQEDINRGLEDGTNTGIEEANAYAQNVLKPQFFDRIFLQSLGNAEESKNLVSTPRKQTELDSSSLVELNKVFNFSTSVEPITEMELSESQAIVTPLDSVISQALSNLKSVSNQVTELENANNAFQAPTKVPFGNPSCSNIYKNVAEFKIACSEAYKTKFDHIYRTVYFDNFKSQYSPLYIAQVEERRDSLIEKLYDNVVAKTYGVAKNAGISAGKKDIYQRNFVSARSKAYDSQLPVASKLAEDTAAVEVGAWISSNATLTIKNAVILGEKLRGNSIGKLSLSVKNISPVALSKPVKVVIKEMRNVSVDRSEAFIKSVNGNETIDFDEINFKVNSNVTSNQQILIKGHVVLSGGKYSSQRIEEFEARALTAINPSITSSLQYDASPRVVTRFRRRTLIHNLDTSISPAVESVRDGYLVSVKAAPGFEGMVSLKNTSYQTGGINYGRSQNIRFQYTFPRSSENKVVKLILTYTYQGETVKSEVVELRPH